VTPKLRALVVARSGGRCESEVFVHGVWLRCASPASDIHHLLTKARGGRNLDRVFEIYHLMHLCRACHAVCDGAEAYNQGMLIQGNVTWDRLTNRPIYQGPDWFLTQEYGTTSG
jgi:hypothetical protein